MAETSRFGAQTWCRASPVVAFGVHSCAFIAGFGQGIDENILSGLMLQLWSPPTIAGCRRDAENPRRNLKPVVDTPLFAARWLATLLTTFCTARSPIPYPQKLATLATFGTCRRCHPHTRRPASHTGPSTQTRR